MSKTARALVLAAVLVSAVSSTVVAQARRHTARTASTATVELRQTAAGAVLVNGAGFTLYRFTKDKKNRDRCVTISHCSTVWPPLTVSGMPTAGPGVDPTKLGTIAISEGVDQVTYNGHPLYSYSGDKGPGETDYIGASQFGGLWYALSAKGKPVK